ncbi:MAG TPA: hypothetical protein VGI19_08360 [Candidatus Cybelea sp.]
MVGEALFGPRWQTDIANALDVSDRNVRRWLADAHQPRPGVWRDLEQLLNERIALQQQARKELRRHIRQIPESPSATER